MTVGWAELAGWAKEDGLAVTDGPGGQGGTVEAGGPSGSIPVTIRMDPDRAVLEHTFDLAPGELIDVSGAGGQTASTRAVLERALDDGPGLLHGAVHGDGMSGSVTMSSRIYADGLSRHAFMRALDELARARRSLDRVRADLAGSRALLTSLNAGMEESLRRMREEVHPDQPAVPATAPDAPVAPAAAAVATPAEVAWSATHAVPAGGIPAWTQPDPAAAPAANLSAGVGLRLEERRGEWARVSAANGWAGWVDGRRLVANG